MRAPLAAVLALAGFVHGALLYGAPLALLHVLHSRLASPRDALVALAWLAALYGLLSAAAFLAAGGAWALATARRPGDRRARAIAAGVFACTLLFWGRYLTMGLTYGEVPLAALRTPAGMLLYVAARLALVAAGAAVLARLLAAPLAAPGRWRRALAGVVAAFVAAHALLPLALARTPPAEAGVPALFAVAPGRAKVVLVGLDGADWQVIEPLVAAGRLPAFARLARAGASGALATIADANSSELWASIYTGEPAAGHGIEDFTRLGFPGMRAPGLYAIYGTYLPNLAADLEALGLARREPVHRADLAATPLWEILLASGVSVGVVDGFYFSYPAPLVDDPESYVLAYGVADEARRLGARGALSAAALAAYVQPPSLAAEVAPLLQAAEAEWQAAVTLDLLRRRAQPRFLHVYTREPDHTQHRYWKWLQPEYYLGVTAADVVRFGGAIPALYERLDRFLGDLLALVDGETVVIVASDHGHSPTMLHPSLYSHHQHGPPGILLMAGGPVVPGRRLAGAHVLDLLPTILYLLGLPVPEDAAGRVLAEALDPALVAATPVRRIGSYDGLAARIRYAGATGGGAAHDPEEVRRLRALGYVE